MEKLESVQKRGFMWILKIYTGFSSKIFYYHTCKQLEILPIKIRFDLKDLTYFHSIFYGISKVKFPDYLTRFQGSNLRCHLDNLCIISSIHPKAPHNLDSEILCSGISKSFFTEHIQPGIDCLFKYATLNQNRHLNQPSLNTFGRRHLQLQIFPQK